MTGFPKILERKGCRGPENLIVDELKASEVKGYVNARSQTPNCSALYCAFLHPNYLLKPKIIIP